MIRWLVGVNRPQDLPEWYRRFVSPVVAIACVLTLLYFLGLFVSTRLARFIDWLMSRVPVVTTIYHAVRGVFESLGNKKGPGRFKRVVSVAYGGPGLRVPGFVTQTMRDVATGRTILSVFVPFAPLPTSGFVLLVDEADVVDLGWTVNETMQGIVSGGLSMPATVRFAAPAQGFEPGRRLGLDLGVIDEGGTALARDDDRQDARVLARRTVGGPVRHPRRIDS